MTGAPDYVDREQLEVLKLGVFGEEEQGTANSAKKAKKAEIDVDGVANLAKLKLTPQEKKEMKSELGAIIDFADRLAGINTDGVPVTAHIVPINNVFREDEVTNSEDRDNLLSNAPTKEDGYMTVPKTFE